MAVNCPSCSIRGRIHGHLNERQVSHRCFDGVLKRRGHRRLSRGSPTSAVDHSYRSLGAAFHLVVGVLARKATKCMVASRAVACDSQPWRCRLTLCRRMERRDIASASSTSRSVQGFRSALPWRFLGSTKDRYILIGLTEAGCRIGNGTTVSVMSKYGNSLIQSDCVQHGMSTQW